MTAYNVAMISSVFYPSIGGIQTHTLHLIQKLQARGVRVVVITRHYPGLSHYEEIAGIPIYRVGKGEGSKVVAATTYMLGALRTLSLLRDHVDILHCHQMISPMTIGLLGRIFTGKPLVINPHRSGPIGDIGILLNRRPLTGRIRIGAARRWGDAFISISPDIHEELRATGVDEDRVWDIANGVDTEHFRPADAGERVALRTALGLPHQRPIIVFAGRLVPEKGIDVLLNAWGDVIRQVPAAYLLLVGEGDFRSSLEVQAAELGLMDHVRFAGGCSDVAPYLRASDAFVLPSRAEGLPVALLEAMACGLPAVATAIGGTTQVLNDSGKGRLVAVENVPALAEGLAEVLTAPEASDWGQRARHHILDHYSLDVVADRYTQLYASLLSGASGMSARSMSNIV